MPRSKGQKNETAPNAAVVATATNDVFSPGAEWYSIKRAAEYLGYGDPVRGAANVRNHIKSADAFKAPGAVRTVQIEGMDIPPIVYVHIAALNAFKAAKESAPSGRAVGGKRDRKRYIIDVPHDKIDAVRATLADTYGIAVRDVPSGKRKTKGAPDAAAASDGDAPMGSDGAIAQVDTDAEAVPA